MLALANSGSATVILLRGQVSTESGKALQLKDEVSPGTTVKTGPRSFAKLLFKDNSQMNVGPDTTLKLELTQAGSPSLVNLVGGQIRAKVTKDLLQGNESQSPEKLIVKTKTAAMGIRGTDFNVSYNQQSSATNLITFEGNVAIASLDVATLTKAYANSMQDAVGALSDSAKVQSVGPGQFSGTQPDQTQVSIPVKISPAQLESLRVNDTYQGLDKTVAKSDALASPIPPGVNAKAFASGGDAAMMASVSSVIGTAAKNAADSTTTGDQKTASPGQTRNPPPEGFFDAKTGAYAPRAGGFIDLASGRYVPPPPGSSFDPNTGVFNPPRAMGNFDPQTGMYVPPKGVELDAVKGFVAESKPGAQPGTAAGTTPGAAPGTSPGAAPATNALTNLLNFAMSPQLAGQQASFEKLFTPTAGGGTFAPPPNFQAPPLPGAPPPPLANNLPPPPKEPVSDPSCPFCQQDNQTTLPGISNVNFQITVQ
ncbi:MAG: FecR family protein [Bdellovibrionota bacterium]